MLVLLIHHRALPFFPPSGRDCPLLRVLAGEAAGEEEGSLPWIVSWLLEGSSYSSLLLRLEPQGGEGGVGFFGKLWDLVGLLHVIAQPATALL